jgi:hypothetical protein
MIVSAGVCIGKEYSSTRLSLRVRATRGPCGKPVWEGGCGRVTCRRDRREYMLQWEMVVRAELGGTKGTKGGFLILGHVTVGPPMGGSGQVGRNMLACWLRVGLGRPIAVGGGGWEVGCDG